MTEDIALGSNPVSGEFTNISLHDEVTKKKKQPKRILHFSDGILEEYSTDEDDEEIKRVPDVDPKTLNWFPWIWYYIVTVSKKTLSVADACGENLAWFLGITSPKYQYAIDEYYRMKEEEEKEKEREERIRKKMEEERLSCVEVDSKEKSDQRILQENVTLQHEQTDIPPVEQENISLYSEQTDRPSVHQEKY